MKCVYLSNRGRSGESTCHPAHVALQMELEEGRRVAEFRRQESESRLRRLQKQQARWGRSSRELISWVPAPDSYVFLYHVVCFRQPIVCKHYAHLSTGSTNFVETTRSCSGTRRRALSGVHPLGWLCTLTQRQTPDIYARMSRSSFDQPVHCLKLTCFPIIIAK